MNLNNQKIKLREFHINDFPSDRIFVYLEEEFHQEVFSKIKEYKFKELNRSFFNNKLNRSTFKQWKKRKTKLKFRIKNYFIPLWFIIKLSKIFPGFSIEIFERNIMAIKGPSSSSIIKNPTLPLPEDKRLMKILAHFIGDGYVGGAFGTKLPKGGSHSEYRNYNPKLLDKFEKDLRVFGTIKLSKNYDHGHIITPNVIGYILRHIYQTRFDSYNSRIPKNLFDLPKELIASFLRAFGDDEGHVYDSGVEYYSNNKELLQDILVLMNKKFPEIKTSDIRTNTKAGKNSKHHFMIYCCSQENYLRLIGFDHNQKQKDIIFNITRRINKYNKDPKRKILKLLRNSSLTSKQISRLLNIRHSTALDYLNELKNLGKVKILRKEHWSNIWTICSK